MRKLSVLSALLFAAFSLNTHAQDYDGSFALPANLTKQPEQYPVAYPRPIPDGELKGAFRTPPRGYGNVPFYWWSGDSLTKERLSYELDLLKDAHTEGFAVSYNHTHPRADKADYDESGFGGFGKTSPGAPAAFTARWKEIWNWFSELCGENRIGVGLDDYTFAWPGNGYYADIAMNRPGVRDYRGELTFKVDTIPGGNKYSAATDENFIGCTAWNAAGESIDLAPTVKDQRIEWTASAGTWTVYRVETKLNYMLHPRYGQEIVENYFDLMERDMTPAQRKGMNFFFQDELHIPLDINTWSADMPDIFRKTKGYDIIPYLAALKGNVGKMTDKVRLDYCEVLMDVAEARYFKPIFDWHWDRGLIYGCDNLGRGLDPASYVDYFRATRWFTAPGNDAPAKGSSLLQCKVSSSIAHLYQRPRTWLEAFHSMGWGSDGEILTAQFDHHAIGGGNLLCLHGLYYSTRGGWWEWAPPDFHFRMPYWPHMKHWLGYAERMTFLLSQGTHTCDVAVIYPTETAQSIGNRPYKPTFEAAMNLFKQGADFDFIDYQSLRRARIDSGRFEVSGESYRVLVIADMPSLHHSSLEKALEHYRAGGIVVATGDLTRSTTLNGSDDPTVDAMVRELFGVSASEQLRGAKPYSRRNAAGGMTLYTDARNIYRDLTAIATPDFHADGQGSAMHRRIGSRDVYMVLNVKPGTEMFFRSKGAAEVWDAFSGEVKPMPILRQDDMGTYIMSEADSARSTLIVFDPSSEPVYRSGNAPTTLITTATTPIEGEWRIEYVPTMDNRYGDFRLPALGDEIIGTEARTFSFMDSRLAPRDWNTAGFDYGKWESGIYGYGLQALTCHVDQAADFAQFAEKCNAHDENIKWEPYEFSWQFGVWDNPGSQGYHGLKGHVSDGFYIMGTPGHHAFRTQVYSPADARYRICTESTRPDILYIDGKSVEGDEIDLRQGWHTVTALYKDVKKQFYTNDMSYVDERTRSATVLIPATSPVPAAHTDYTPQLGMKWADAEDRLLSDPNGGTVRSYCFLFDAAPGLESLEMNLLGENPKIWIDGKQIAKGSITKSVNSPRNNRYIVSLPARKERVSRVAIELQPHRGYSTTGAFDGAVKLKCTEGLMTAGDWSRAGQLLHYSGGMWYRKTIGIDKKDPSQRIILDLGDVVATCEVHVNGKKAGVMLNKPFSADITDLVNDGENAVEVLVYSTLSNHYQIIPTPPGYRGDARAGMIGPVVVEYKTTK